MENGKFIKIVVVLFLLVFCAAGCHKPQPKKAKTAETGSAAVESIVRQKASEKERDVARFNVLINRLDQRNPFAKDHAGIYKLKMASGTLNLGGILYDGQRPMAIINNQIVREGDIIDKKEVVKITSEEVVLKDIEEERTYKLEVIK